VRSSFGEAQSGDVRERSILVPMGGVRRALYVAPLTTPRCGVWAALSSRPRLPRSVYVLAGRTSAPPLGSPDQPGGGRCNGELLGLHHDAGRAKSRAGASGRGRTSRRSRPTTPPVLRSRRCIMQCSASAYQSRRPRRDELRRILRGDGVPRIRSRIRAGAQRSRWVAPASTSSTDRPCRLRRYPRSGQSAARQLHPRVEIKRGDRMRSGRWLGSLAASWRSAR